MSILLTLDSSILSANSQGVSDDFTVSFPTNIPLGDSQWEVGLLKSNLWYSWYNISSGKNNNSFRYFNGTIYATVLIPDGQYTLDQINEYLHGVMRENGDFTLDTSGQPVYDIIIEPNFSTIRTKITLTNSYTLDLSSGNLYLLLGGDQVEYTMSGDLPQVANINDNINSLLIRCSLVDGRASYKNSVKSDVLYSFVPSSTPGTNIDVNIANPIYIPISITNNLITEIRMYITDNLSRSLDLNGEPTTYLLHLRKV